LFDTYYHTPDFAWQIYLDLPYDTVLIYRWLQCFDAVGWATGSASGKQNFCFKIQDPAEDGS